MFLIAEVNQLNNFAIEVHIVISTDILHMICELIDLHLGSL